MQHAAIGLFDSGVGGSSIWLALQAELPQENTCYLADNANAPYGEKTPQEIIELCQANCEFLLSKGCKLIIIACNTASAAAAAYLRQHYRLPIVAVEPAIKPAALASRTGKIGILATSATLASANFHANIAKHLQPLGVEVIARSGKGIVELIENNQLNSPEMSTLLSQHCAAFAQAGIDQLVLGCTHYPYLRPQLAALLPQVSLIDSGAAVARQTKRLLAAAQLLNSQAAENARHEWISTGDCRVLQQFAPLGQRIECYRL